MEKKKKIKRIQARKVTFIRPPHLLDAKLKRAAEKVKKVIEEEERVLHVREFQT